MINKKIMILFSVLFLLLNCSQSRRCINTFKSESNLKQRIYLHHIETSKKVEIKIGKPIDLISDTDSLISPKEWGCGWELLEIKSDTIFVKKKALIEKIIRVDSLEYYTNLGWWEGYWTKNSNDSTKIFCQRNIEQNMPIRELRKMRYAKFENYTGSGDFIPAILLLATPFAPWKDWKFRWNIFFQIVGANVLYTSIVHYLPRKLAEFKEYKISEWEFKVIN